MRAASGPRVAHRSEGVTWARLLLIGAATLVLLSVASPDFAREGWKDEYLLPWYGKHVAAGDAPYRDFFMFIGPLAAYLSGAIVALAGETIVPFKLLFILAGVTGTLAMFEVSRSRNASLAVAFAAAAILPLLLIPVWPSSTHQWLAVHAGLIAAWLACNPAAGSLRLVAAGLFAAVSVLIVQTVGILGLAAAALLCADRTHGRARALGSLAAGGLIALAACGVLLVRDRALGAWFELAILWPIEFYKQPDGYNAVLPPLWLAPPTAFEASGGVARAAIALVPLLALTAFTVQSLTVWRSRADRNALVRHALVLGVLILAWLIFQLGRSDAPHLAYISPLFLIVLAARSAVVHAAWIRPALMASAAVPLVAWIFLWRVRPPDPAGVLMADAHIAAALDATGLSADRLGARTQPVVHLSTEAAVFYFYAAGGIRPPVDWVTPPSSATYGTAEYRRLAGFIRANDVPIIVIGRENLRFLVEDSALRDLIRERYAVERSVNGAAVLVRRDGA